MTVGNQNLIFDFKAQEKLTPIAPRGALDYVYRTLEKLGLFTLSISKVSCSFLVSTNVKEMKIC